MPVAKTYGYDGQFFYRLALNPLNFHHTAYGITMDRPYRFMRIGYPALTWLVSAGQHSLVPVMLVVVNIAAIGALGYLGARFAARRRTARAGRAADPRVLRPPHQPVPGHRGAARRRPSCWPGCSRSGAAGRCWPPRCLAYGALTRETVMVAVAAIAIMRVTGMLRRPGRGPAART